MASDCGTSRGRRLKFIFRCRVFCRNICVIMADMKISIKNFGPIREAKDMQIAPMTLFVGPSNTGKSYLAVLLYVIAKILAGARRGMMPHPSEDHTTAKKLAKKLRGKSYSETLSPRETESLFLLWAKFTADAWRQQMLYCFGEEGENLVNKRGISVTVSSGDGGIVLNLTEPEKSRINPKAQSFAAEHIGSIKDGFSANSPSLRFSDFWRRAEVWVFTPQLLQCASTSPYYLPAIRGGIMQSHRMLVDAVIKQAPMVGLADARFRGLNSMPAFTGVLSDFMLHLIRLPGVNVDMHHVRMQRRLRSKIVAIGKRMEPAIMEGNIQVEMNEADYPDYRYQFSKGEKKTLSLPLKNTSSMVSELAPVSIFLRYHLGKGDLFIVEEPEAHLHPGGQRAISEVLAQLANAGVFVLATTHSDVILEQCSNFVHASKINGTAAAKRNAAKIAGAVLTEEQAAVYSFADGGKHGTVVKKVEFDSEYGVLTSDHLKESTGLYNRTVQLLNGRESERND